MWQFKYGIDFSGGTLWEIKAQNLQQEKIIETFKQFQIDNVIDTSLSEGMISLDRALANLVLMDEISLEKAIEFSLNPTRLKYLLEK